MTAIAQLPADAQRQVCTQQLQAFPFGACRP